MAFVIAILLALVAGGIAQAADPSTSAPAVVQEQKDTLVVGSEQDYPPFATGMTDDTAGGFTVDLWKAVAAEAGLNYTIRVRPFRQILQEFKEGKIDVLINLAQSNERHRLADFTVPHVIVHGAIFVRKGETGIRSENDLAGKSLIVLNADLAHDYAVAKGWEKQLVLVDTAAEGMRLLASGKHDAMLLGKLPGMQTRQALGLTNIEPLIVKVGFSQKFAFAVQEGQSELLGKINEGLALTKSNGTYDALYDKWFGVYEVKEAGLRDLLKYLIPVVGLFLAIAGHSFYRRQIEHEAAEKKYRDLYDQAPDMFLSTDARTATIIDCNQTLLTATGYSRKELIGRPVLDLYHPDCADIARTACQTFLNNKEVHGVELQVLRKDGSIVEVSLNASAVCNDKGAILHSRAVLRDISERKSTEEKLRTLSAAVEQSPTSVVITDLKANILYVNPQFTKVTGYAFAEAIGQNPRILQSGTMPKEVYVEMWNKLLGGQEWHGELANKRKNGALYWEDAHIAAVKNPAGMVTHYVAVKVDITGRKQTEEALRLLNETLDQRVRDEVTKNREKDHLLIQQARLAAMGEMIGNIAHQWRQPLNALGLLLTNIKDAYEYKELDANYLDTETAKGRQLIDKMSTTIDDFRNFFKPNKMKENFGMAKAVEVTLTLVSHSLKNHNIAVAVESRHEILASGFPNEFSQVLLNIFNNAKDALLEKKVAAGKIDVALGEDGAQAWVAIRDNAGGIPEDILPKIFDPYFTTREKGTGIGLYMSKMIMEHMNGTVEVRNVDGGAEFRLTLPGTNAAG